MKILPFILTAAILAGTAQAGDAPPVATETQRAEVIRVYPEMADIRSPLKLRFLDLYEKARRDEAELFTHDNWPMELARRAAVLVAKEAREHPEDAQTRKMMKAQIDTFIAKYTVPPKPDDNPFVALAAQAEAQRYWADVENGKRMAKVQADRDAAVKAANFAAALKACLTWTLAAAVVLVLAAVWWRWLRRWRPTSGTVLMVAVFALLATWICPPGYRKLGSGVYSRTEHGFFLLFANTELRVDFERLLLLDAIILVSSAALAWKLRKGAV